MKWSTQTLVVRMQQFASKERLAAHEDCHKKGFKCSKCPEVFKTVGSKYWHYRKKHMNKTVRNNVNPYHQAWSAQAEQRPGLSLVEEASVAHIVMGGNNVVEMFDFQINQKQFPPAFFKKDPKTGIQRRFTCLVCNVSLFDENLVRTHCFSQVIDLDHASL